MRGVLCQVALLLAALPAAAQPPAMHPPENRPTLQPTTAPSGEPVLKINLATALQLAGAKPLEIALASERVRLAEAQLARSRVLCLPTIYLGGDYLRHDGAIQDVGGQVFNTSRSALMVGAGPSAVFSVTDAIFAPLAARQVLRAREADLEASRNDSLLEVAEAYINVQQARGELSAAEDVVRRTAELSRRADELGKTLIPAVEAIRVRTELSRRKQLVHAARQRYRSNSAELVRVLRLTPGTLVEPEESPDLVVKLIGLERRLEELLELATANRPELASGHAQMQAGAERLRQEQWRPLLPGVMVRGTSTNPAGTLAAGYFGGGRRDFIGNSNMRGDLDVQVVWELQNLGFGNRARVKEQTSALRLAELELQKTRDRVLAEVVQSRAELIGAMERLEDSQVGAKDAQDSAEKNQKGMGQTRRVGNAVLLVIRPQEAVAAIQALALSYADYFGATADFNRAQFRLYRALGRPATGLTAGAEISDRATTGAITSAGGER